MGPVVAAEPFGRLEEIGPGIWAMVSTPLGGDRTTLANGGIVAGRSGVLVIEGFFQTAGAAWIATKARELAGRHPTHVLLTHYHADHVNGLAGLGAAGPMPAIRATTTTGALVRERNNPADETRNRLLAGAEPVDPNRPGELDLGGRVVRIVPASGHTASDLAVIVEDPRVVFGGDLLWHGMFPNYVDAVPTALGRAVRALRQPGDARYVPGHGPVGGAAELDRCAAMLDEVERAARAAHARGQSASDAAAGYTLPASLGEWILFSPRFMETAFAAWYRELGA